MDFNTRTYIIVVNLENRRTFFWTYIFFLKSLRQRKISIKLLLVRLYIHILYAILCIKHNSLEIENCDFSTQYSTSNCFCSPSPPKTKPPTLFSLNTPTAYKPPNPAS